MKRAYPMMIEKGDNGILYGYFPDLPGLTVGGKTRDEIVALAREFMADYLADHECKGQPWPDAPSDMAWVEITSQEVEAVLPQARADLEAIRAKTAKAALPKAKGRRGSSTLSRARQKNSAVKSA